MSRGHAAPPADPQHPWERQHGESLLAHHAARAYFELDPPNRSIRRVCEMLGKRPGYARSLERWASLHHWVDRSAAWDQHQQQAADERAIQEAAEDQRKAIERHRAQFEAAAQALMLPIRELVERMVRKDKAFAEELQAMPARTLMELTFRCARVLPLAVRGERISRGLPDWAPIPEEDEVKESEFRIVVEAGAVPAPPSETEASKPQEA